MIAKPEVLGSRPEHQVFGDLIEACRDPQAPHAIAVINIRDNYAGFSKGLTGKSLLGLHSRNRLVTSEFNALVGCFAKTERSVGEFSPDRAFGLVETFDKLFEELHEAMREEAYGRFFDNLKDDGPRKFLTGPVVREAVFHAGDSAYSFQYRDFSQERYEADSEWLRGNKGFDLEHARTILGALPAIQGKTLDRIRHGQSLEDLRSPLSAFRVDAGEIVEHTGLGQEVVAAFIDAFVTR